MRCGGGKMKVLQLIKEIIPSQIKRRIKSLFKNLIDSAAYYLKDGMMGNKIEGSNKILFICKGNICRSAFAEYRLKMITQQASMDFDIYSCGIDANQSSQSPHDAITVAREYGLDLTNHVPKLVTSTYMDEADIILAMEYHQFMILKKLYPNHTDKMGLLREFMYFPQNLLVNIDDPYGWGIPAFRKSFGMIDISLRGFVKRLDEQDCKINSRHLP